MANIYVRKSGNDANDGSTPELAKLTIAGAISAMVSGDTIYVGAGIYREQNLLTGAKTVSIIGDTTGLYTGDAGEVIWSGMNATDDTYTAVDYAINSNTDDCNLDIQNIFFQNWRLTGATNCACIKKNTTGNINIKNIKGSNIFHYGNAAQHTSFSGLMYLFHAGTTYTTNIENIYLKNCSSFSYNATAYINSVYGIYVGIKDIVAKNIKVENFEARDTVRTVKGYAVYLFDRGTTQIQNIEVNKAISNYYVYGLFLDQMNTKQAQCYNCLVHNLLADYAYGLVISTTYNSNGTIYNSSVTNILGTLAYAPYYNNWHSSNFAPTVRTDKANYTIPQIDLISKFSPLRGQGNATQPTTDILNNPIPAYGNTTGDIGALANTAENIQREATIKDSGDYSIKVSPCNYFKKVFQVPVTASELRTVKVKIRIDGTWGDYRPRITLSGQGMTLSTATKNTTTGSFEELTVSGTPTTTGIALLTIEAHSASTDAVFYIDTITIE